MLRVNGRTSEGFVFFIIAGLFFLAYLPVAATMAVAPIYAVTVLHSGSGFAGLAVGVAFLATLLSRSSAGRFADTRGGKYCLALGFKLYVAACLLCCATALHWSRLVDETALVVGRGLMGVAESLALIGVISWGISYLGPTRSGKVMALVGMGMYGAFAVGSPLGVALLHLIGFPGLMLACAAVLFAAAMGSRTLPETAQLAVTRESFWRIIGQIWPYGLVVGLQGVGFAAVASFMALDFLGRGWLRAGFGLTSFGISFVLVRILAGHLPDRIGGLKLAALSLMVEAIGQYTLWAAPGPLVAFAGAFLTGAGCSMVFPSMGTEVVRIVSPQRRSTALSGFAAFQDCAYGTTGPVAGWLIGGAHYEDVFLGGGVSATLGVVVALMIMWAGAVAAKKNNALIP